MEKSQKMCEKFRRKKVEKQWKKVGKKGKISEKKEIFDVFWNNSN